MHVSVETGYCWYSRFIHSFAHTAQDGSACLRWDSTWASEPSFLRTRCFHATALFRRGVGEGGGSGDSGPQITVHYKSVVYVHEQHAPAVYEKKFVRSVCKS